MNSDGSDVIRLTHNDGDDREPDWSPDGSKITFASNHYPEPYDIYIMDADGSHMTNLTHSPSNSDSYPSWSPDGTRIAFSRFVGNAAGADLYVINVDGSGLLKIVDGGGEIYNLMPTWSPDGSEIMFTSGRSEAIPGATSAFGGLTIHKVNADGSGEMRISKGGVNTYGNLDWSWANDKIAFYDAAVTGTAIFTMDSTITNIVRVTPSSDDEDQSQFRENPSWSPDGNKILYERVALQPRPTSEIYVIDVATGAEANISNNHDADDTSLDWGPIFTVPPPIPIETLTHGSSSS
jgi:Tol biopolymer transport system component